MLVNKEVEEGEGNNTSRNPILQGVTQKASCLMALMKVAYMHFQQNLVLKYFYPVLVTAHRQAYHNLHCIQ